ncbi:uncharacterized protein [Hyperolius riggenbachi]|uniref:uncharacterized protein n=1 Tax=Hyperolius riggenbachi TaxID=752182 RepID=UPI0035A37E1B
MSSSWDSSRASFFMSHSNVTLTETMNEALTEYLNEAFVGRLPTRSSSPFQPQLQHLDSILRTGSSPFQPLLEQLDSRVCPKAVVSPLLVSTKEGALVASGGEKLWLGVEETGSSVCPSPLNPDMLLFEQSSLASEQLGQCSNSIVGLFYGAKMSTPNKEEDSMETSNPLEVDITMPRQQGSEDHIKTLQKPVSPVWEISEIKYALEENTPSLEVSISDLRFPNVSTENELPVPVLPSPAPPAQWVGTKHKDMGRSYLLPFHYRRQLSASEVPIASVPTPGCSIQIIAGKSHDKLEWQIEGTSETLNSLQP